MYIKERSKKNAVHMGLGVFTHSCLLFIYFYYNVVQVVNSIFFIHFFNKQNKTKQYKTILCY